MGGPFELPFVYLYYQILETEFKTKDHNPARFLRTKSKFQIFNQGFKFCLGSLDFVSRNRVGWLFQDFDNKG